jgi:hypothetical protein
VSLFEAFTQTFVLIFRHFTESEKGSKLDTLPEEKSHHSPSQIQSPTAIPTIQTSSAEPYRRVYPEWKPSSTLEKTDVVGTIETLAGMTCKKLFSSIVYRATCFDAL